MLFICGRNKWRSPTAEQIFSGYPGIECSSAGLNHDSENPLTLEQIEWADIIFVMEKKHKAKLSAGHKEYLKGKRVVCLDIPDKFRYMDPVLVNLLESKVTPLLP